MVTTMSENLLSKLRRHGNEFARALRNGHYERTDSGLYFRAAKVMVGGVISHSVDDGPWVLDNNTATLEGLDDILSVYLAGGAQHTAYYFAPYSNNVAPDQTITAANFVATMGEFTNYTAGSRQGWTPGAVAGQSVDNTASTAQLVIGTGGGTVRGSALVTASAKSATTGKLPFIAAFTDGAAVLNAGSKLNLEYTVSAQDVG